MLQNLPSGFSDREEFISNDEAHVVLMLKGDLNANKVLYKSAYSVLSTPKLRALLIENDILCDLSNPPCFRSDTEAFYVNNDGDAALYFMPYRATLSATEYEESFLPRSLQLRLNGFFPLGAAETAQKIAECEQPATGAIKVNLNELMSDRILHAYGQNAWQVKIPTRGYLEMMKDRPDLAALIYANIGRGELLDKMMFRMRTAGAKETEVRIFNSKYVTSEVDPGCSVTCPSVIDLNTFNFAVNAYADPSHPRTTYVFGIKRNYDRLLVDQSKMRRLTVPF
jgi:hypothetical protein